MFKNTLKNNRIFSYTSGFDTGTHIFTYIYFLYFNCFRVTKQYAMDESDWNSSIVNMWIKHRGLDKEEVMLEYLKLVQNLEMYGVTYFNIKNRKGTDVLLGVTSLGLNIYKTEDR